MAGELRLATATEITPSQTEVLTPGPTEIVAGVRHGDGAGLALAAVPPNADAAPTAAVATAVSLQAGPDAGHAGVVTRHALRPVEDGQGRHHHLRVLQAVAQPLQDGGEVGSLLGYRVPALTHQPVQRARAVVGRLQAATVGHQLHHLLVGAAGVRHVAQGHHLPQQDTEGPGTQWVWLTAPTNPSLLTKHLFSS